MGHSIRAALTLLGAVRTTKAQAPQWNSLDGAETARFAETGVIEHAYFDDTPDKSSRARGYSTAELLDALSKAKKQALGYYGETDDWLRNALAEAAHPNWTYAVIGSVKPWYECLLADSGASHVLVIEYHQIVSPDLTDLSEADAALLQRIAYFTPAQFAFLRDLAPTELTVDAVVSVSSVEHDGLGRYGDPVDPDGDLKSMAKHRALLLGGSEAASMETIARFAESNLDFDSSRCVPGKLLFLSMPVGRDCTYWNAHRVYGANRLARLFRGWGLVSFHDGNAVDRNAELLAQVLALAAVEADCTVSGVYLWAAFYQPVFVLCPLATVNETVEVF